MKRRCSTFLTGAADTDVFARPHNCGGSGFCREHSQRFLFVRTRSGAWRERRPPRPQRAVSLPRFRRGARLPVVALWSVPSLTCGGSPFSLSLLPFCPLRIFLCSELHNLANQAERNWPIEWKPYGALSSFIGRQLFFEFLNSSWRRIEPDASCKQQNRSGIYLSE
jgi:hypothetical protein